MLSLFTAASLASLAGSAFAQSASAVAATTAAATAATSAFTPLASKSFSYTDLPYQVDTDPTGRGPQSGYNICNSTTLGPNSNCQTLIINSVEDFCLWGPPIPDSDVGDTEAASVAWCTTNTHGTRVIPQGAITGVQFISTPNYIQVTGVIQQSLIDMDPNDGGGEMDPHGADGRGNPLGALVFSNFWSGGSTDYLQVVEWNNFMGSNIFCFKACDPNTSAAEQILYCNNVYDLIGCEYNMPASYQDGIFESCLGDNQLPVGLYVVNGVTSTYTQPADSLGAVTTMPYTAAIPASSSCTTYSSAAIYSSQPLPSVPLTMSDSPTGISPSGGVTASSSFATVTAGTSKATTTGKGSSSTSKSTSSSTAKSAAGAGVKFGMGGVWSVVVGIAAAGVGAVVAL